MYEMLTTEDLNAYFRFGRLEKVEEPTIFYDRDDTIIRDCMEELAVAFKDNFDIREIDGRKPGQPVPYGALYVSSDLSLKNKQFINGNMNCLFFSKELKDNYAEQKRIAEELAEIRGMKVLTATLSPIRLEILMLTMLLAADHGNYSKVFRLLPEQTGIQEEIDTVYIEDIGLYNPDLEEELQEDWVAQNKMGELDEEKDRSSFISYMNRQIRKNGILEWKDFPILAEGFKALSSKLLFFKAKPIYVSETLEKLFGTDDMLNRLAKVNIANLLRCELRKRYYWEKFILKADASFDYLEKIFGSQEETLRSFQDMTDQAWDEACQEIKGKRISDDARKDLILLKQGLALSKLEKTEGYLLAYIREYYISEMFKAISNSELSSARKRYRDILKELKYYVADSQYFMQDRNLRAEKSMLDRIKTEWPNRRAMVSSAKKDPEIASDREVTIVQGLAEKTVVLMVREPIKHTGKIESE